MRHKTVGFEWVMIALILVFTASAVAQSNESVNRSFVIAAMSKKFGAASPSNSSTFKLKDNYQIVATFAPSGELIGMEIIPGKMPDSITPEEFQDTIQFINSVKPLGRFEERLGASSVTGMREHRAELYSAGYMSISEELCRKKPCPVASARIDYLYPKTVIVQIPESFSLKDAGSFGLYCIQHQRYRLPLPEAKKAVDLGISRIEL
jgi:hypothetical protein